MTGLALLFQTTKQLHFSLLQANESLVKIYASQAIQTLQVSNTLPSRPNQLGQDFLWNFDLEFSLFFLSAGRLRSFEPLCDFLEPRRIMRWRSQWHLGRGIFERARRDNRQSRWYDESKNNNFNAELYCSHLPALQMKIIVGCCEHYFWRFHSVTSFSGRRYFWLLHPGRRYFWLLYPVMSFLWETRGLRCQRK